MATAIVTLRGRLTLPRELRVSLGLVIGDRLDSTRLEDGAYAIVPATDSVRSLKGVLPRRAQPVSPEDMDAAIEAGAGRSRHP